MSGPSMSSAEVPRFSSSATSVYMIYEMALLQKPILYILTTLTALFGSNIPRSVYFFSFPPIP